MLEDKQCKARSGFLRPFIFTRLRAYTPVSMLCVRILACLLMCASMSLYVYAHVRLVCICVGGRLHAHVNVALACQYKCIHLHLVPACTCAWWVGMNVQVLHANLSCKCCVQMHKVCTATQAAPVSH